MEGMNTAGKVREIGVGFNKLKEFRPGGTMVFFPLSDALLWPQTGGVLEHADPFHRDQPLLDDLVQNAGQRFDAVGTVDNFYQDREVGR